MRPDLRLDIVEEHLDEAAFLYGQWEAALRSPAEALADVACGPEEQLLAHLDALAVAGTLAAERLLAPALAGKDEGRAFASAFVLAARPEGLPAVLEALAGATPPVHAAIERALQVLPVPDLGARLRALAESAAPAARLAIARALIARREDPGIAVGAMIDSRDPAEVALGLRAVRVLGKSSEAHRVAGLIRSKDLHVSAAAMETGLVMGLREAWSACEHAIAERGAELAPAARLRALSGDAGAVEPLLEASADAGLRRPALVALGYTGRVAAAEALLELMDGSLGRLAGEAFSAITGLGLEGPYRAEEPPEREEPIPFEEEDLDADLVPGPEARLPLPDAEAVTRWWRRERGRFDPGRRYLRGRPFTCSVLLEELAGGPMRRREALSLELAIRTRGQAQVDVFALSARQRANIESARGAVGRAWAARFHDLPAAVEVPIRPAAAPVRAVPRAARAPDARDVVVSGIGLATPLGDAVQSFAAVRAGIDRFLERPDLHACLGPDGRPDRDDPIVASGFPREEAGPRDGNRPAEWLACIAGRALREAKEGARLRPDDRGRLGLFLAVPAGRSASPEQQGAALAAVLEELAAAARTPPILVADLNGERWRMKEWGYALARLGSRLPAPLALEHPAMQLGDVGAASAGVLVPLAAQLLAKKYPDRGSAIVWAASEDGDRRGLLLEQA